MLKITLSTALSCLLLSGCGDGPSVSELRSLEGKCSGLANIRLNTSSEADFRVLENIESKVTSSYGCLGMREIIYFDKEGITKREYLVKDVENDKELFSTTVDRSMGADGVSTAKRKVEEFMNQ